MSIMDDILKSVQQTPIVVQEIMSRTAKEFVLRSYPGAAAYLDEDHCLREARWHIWDDTVEKWPNPVLGSGDTPEAAWREAATNLVTRKYAGTRDVPDVQGEANHTPL